MSAPILADQQFKLQIHSPLSGVSKLVQRLVTVVTIALTALMIVDIAVQVFYRFVLNNSITWSDELGRYLFLWSVFWERIKNNSLPVFGSVVNLLPPSGGYTAILISRALIIGFCLNLFILSINLLPTFSNTFSPTLQINVGYLYAIFPLFAAISILHVMTHIWENRKGIKALGWIISFLVVAALGYVATTNIHFHLSFPVTLVILLLIMFSLGVPIAFVICITSVGLLFLSTTNPLTVIPQRMFLISDNFSLMAIPFFMMTGALMQVGGVS